MAEVDREFPDVVAATAHSRFRSPSDLSIAASFAQHYGVATGRAVLGEIATEYVHVESGRLVWHLDAVSGSVDDVDTCCVNETTIATEQVDREPASTPSFRGVAHSRAVGAIDVPPVTTSRSPARLASPSRPRRRIAGVDRRTRDRRSVRPATRSRLERSRRAVRSLPRRATGGWRRRDRVRVAPSDLIDDVVDNVARRATSTSTSCSSNHDPASAP